MTEQAKHPSALFHVCACTVVKSTFSEKTGGYKILTISNGVTIASEDVKSLEYLVRQAFLVEMDYIGFHKMNEPGCIINPNALRAYDKHMAWVAKNNTNVIE